MLWGKIFLLPILILCILFGHLPKKEKATIVQHIEPTPAVSATPASTETPQPTPAPREKKLDSTALHNTDTTKKGWGVVLKGNGQVPPIPADTKLLLEKYNAHYTGDTSRRKLYLVFSAGYESGHTPRILDTLKENTVQGVFFLVGDYVKKNPELVKRMLEEGHHVGGHSMTHPSLPLVDLQRLEYEMVGYEKFFIENFGKGIKYFMPPSGEYSERVLAAAHQLEYKTIFWSFAYKDYDEKDQRGANYAYNKVMPNLHNGAFIFLHLVSRDNAEALDRIIKDTRAKGYELGDFDI